MRGVVTDFDAQRGDGTFQSDEGERLYFHCVEIADGSRSIDVGARVVAQRGVGHLGHDEARQLRASAEVLA